VDALGYLGAANADQLVQLGPQLRQSLFRDVLSPVVHREEAPIWLRPQMQGRDKRKNFRVTLGALKFGRRVS
jgi:hypothetical protein